MDFAEDFYIVLPSNSSEVYYPDNTTTCFTTHMSREIRLTGEWLIGLSEIHIPCTVEHVQKSEAFYTFQVGSKDDKKKSESMTVNFPSGVYKTVEELAAVINNVSDVREHQQLVPMDFKKGYYKLKRTCNCEDPHSTTFNEKIRRIFGFEDFTHRHEGTFVTSMAKKDYNKGNRPACLARAIPDQLFVYTDVCEAYPIGDTHASLLRIVSLDSSKYKFGSTVVKQFAPIQYVPVLHHNFQSIDIDIRDAQGQRIPFSYGTLIAILHCKRNRY